MNITTDDGPDYWTCRSPAGAALLLELEQVTPVRIPDPDPDWPPALGEVLRGYRVTGRAAAAAYTTGGEENWGTLGIAADLDRRFTARRAEAITRRAHDAARIGRRHPAHHCGTVRGRRCPLTGERTAPLV